MNKNVDIIGPYPPPFGGVSIHISRIIPLMRENGLNPIVYNQYNYENEELKIFATRKSIKWWLTYFFKNKSPVVHFHQFSILHFPYLLLLSRLSSSKIILSIHNEKILTYPRVLRLAILNTLKYSRLSCIIIVSKKLCSTMNDHKIKNVTWLPAYVPPPKTQSTPLPNEYGIKVAYNAAQLSDINAIETYGADLLLRLARDNPSIGFYIFIGEPSSKLFFEDYISQYNIKNCMVFYGKPLVEYLASANIFLRLNRKDAYGISIDEALDLGVIAIASDVCTRAKGCILYKNNDYDDLSRVFYNTINKPSEDNQISREPSKYHLQLIEIYKNLLS